MTEHIIEDDYVSPVGVRPPVVAFGNKAVSNVAGVFVFDEVFDLVTFGSDMPGDVVDQAIVRDKKEFHTAGTPF